MRITGGLLRSRKLVAPSGATTRPTTDRTREALFSILSSAGAFAAAPRVLDLYAGTGALGLEALSRGGVHATFVEQDRGALVALRTNVTTLGQERTTAVLGLPVARALARLGQQGLTFDLVFADPPYADVTEGRVAKELDRALALFADGGRLVLEFSSRDKEAPAVDGLECEDVRRYGDTKIALYRRRLPFEGGPDMKNTAEKSE